MSTCRKEFDALTIEMRLVREQIAELNQNFTLLLDQLQHRDSPKEVRGLEIAVGSTVPVKMPDGKTITPYGYVVCQPGKSTLCNINTTTRSQEHASMLAIKLAIDQTEILGESKAVIISATEGMLTPIKTEVTEENVFCVPDVLHEINMELQHAIHSKCQMKNITAEFNPNHPGIAKLYSELAKCRKEIEESKE